MNTKMKTGTALCSVRNRHRPLVFTLFILPLTVHNALVDYLNDSVEVTEKFLLSEVRDTQTIETDQSQFSCPVGFVTGLAFQAFLVMLSSNF